MAVMNSLPLLLQRLGLYAESERINSIRWEDQLGKNQWELFPATRGTVHERERRRAVAEQVAVQFEFYYEPWNSWFLNKAYPTKDGGLSVFYHDITARKRSEEAMRQAHEPGMEMRPGRNRASPHTQSWKHRRKCGSRVRICSASGSTSRLERTV
jgi:hypothetical protein